MNKNTFTRQSEKKSWVRYPAGMLGLALMLATAHSVLAKSQQSEGNLSGQSSPSAAEVKVSNELPAAGNKLNPADDVNRNDTRHTADLNKIQGAPAAKGSSSVKDFCPWCEAFLSGAAMGDQTNPSLNKNADDSKGTKTPGTDSVKRQNPDNQG